MDKIKNFKLWKILRQPEMLILPGNIAFFLVMSLVPIISFFGIIASIFSLSTDTLVNAVNNFLPTSVSSILLPFIDGSNLSANNIFFTLTGFYLCSNGPDSIIVASNLLYKTENKNYIYRRIKALFLTFFVFLLLIFILLFLTFGNLIINWLSSYELIGEVIRNSYILIIILKFIISFFFIFFFIKILYTLAPDKNIKSSSVNGGSFFATLAILLVTSIFSYYVTNIARYDIIYGNLSNIMILIFMVYLISYIIVLGIAINANSIENKK